MTVKVEGLPEYVSEALGRQGREIQYLRDRVKTLEARIDDLERRCVGVEEVMEGRGGVHCLARRAPDADNVSPQTVDEQGETPPKRRNDGR